MGVEARPGDGWFEGVMRTPLGGDMVAVRAERRGSCRTPFVISTPNPTAAGIPTTRITFLENMPAFTSHG
jgi:hypothetical protein